MFVLFPGWSPPVNPVGWIGFDSIRRLGEFGGFHRMLCVCEGLVWMKGFGSRVRGLRWWKRDKWDSL